MDFLPRIIFWETTKQCNLRCGYCRRLLDQSGPELTSLDALRIIREIKDVFGKPMLILSGGEPLLRKDIFEIIYYAYRADLPVALATNGVMLNDTHARRLKEFGVKRVSISLDAGDELAHDLSRGIRGAFRKTLDAAAILRKHGVPFQLNHTLTKSNYHEISRVADLALSLGAVAVHYFVLVPVGCGKGIESSAMLDAKDCELALSAIRQLADALPLEIRPTCAPHYIRFSKDSRDTGCLAGTAAFFISSEGEIYPCGYLPVKAGSLRNNSIREIWECSPVLKELRENNLKGACSGCELKQRCRGCRARAFGMSNDYLAADETCGRVMEELPV